jgi:ABC-type multidrug transport system ATPase subunit
MINALEFQGVTKRYGRRTALNGLDLSVPSGSIFGLVGSNGAGKTTAMALAVGLLRLDSGAIDVLGQGAFHPGRQGGRVTLLPQDSRLPLHARVGELLTYYGRLQGVKGQRLKRTVDEVLDWTHLKDRRDSPVRTLSHGMMRRVTIAQAFLGEPDLILLDEPLSGLDPREQVRIRDMLQLRRGQQTLLISSHNLHELEALCDQVAFVELGRRIRQDSLDAVIRRRHSLTVVLDGPLTLPGAALTEAIPGIQWSYDSVRSELTLLFPDEWTPARVNGTILPLLVDSECGILEVRLGSGLEREYLRATEPPKISGGIP